MHWTAVAPSVLASFLASMVEFVEALTIVLAVGIVRGWRSALLGTGAALLVLAALVLASGPSLTRVPIHQVQLVVGTLLLLFGLRWLRKAVLRAAGVLALHDEAKVFADETETLRRRSGAAAQAIDGVAFATSFKIVMLEGIEVVFIVIAIGAGGGLLLPAALGALLALAVVVLLGLCLHRPLATLPENALKFGVGVMLAAFGTFWVGEGVGIGWPGGDAALPVLIGAFLLLGLVLVPLCRRFRRLRARPHASKPAAAAVLDPDKPGVFGRVWNELVGLFVDDGVLAAGIVLWVAAARAVPSGALHASATRGAVAFTAGLVVLLAASALRRAGSRTIS
jgi:Ca2+/H+ antiporter, TMEM165/GDT1 family